MKFNWGTGIFLFYSVFASSLFYQVYKSTQYDHSLVVEHYYEKDLAYQKMYERKANSLNLSEKLRITYHEPIHSVELVFPKTLTVIGGTVLFYRANNKKQDLVLPIEVNSLNEMHIPVELLANGRWKIEVEWEGAGKKFFDAETIML